MKYFLSFAVCLFLFSSNLNAQNSIANDSLLAIEYFNIADTSYLDVPKCLKYTQLAIPLLRKTEQWEKYIYCLNALSFCYNQLEDYKAMEESSRFAFAEAKRLLPREHNLYAGALNNLGYVHYAVREDYEAAEKFYLKGLAEIPETNLNTLGVLYENLSSVKRKAGDFEAAINYLTEAKRLFEIRYDKLLAHEQPVNLRVAIVLQSRSSLYHFLKDYDASIKDLNAALFELEKGWKKDSVYFVRIYTALADNYFEKGAYGEAKGHLLRAKSYGAKTPKQLSGIEHVYGKIYFSEGDVEKALERMNVALDLLPEKRKVSRAAIYQSMAEGCFSMEAYDEAIQFCEAGLRELSEDREGGFSDGKKILSLLGAINILKVRAHSLTAQNMNASDPGGLSEAFEAWKQLAQFIDILREEFSSEASKIYLSELTVENYSYALKCAHHFFRLTQEDKFLHLSFFFSEKSRAAVLEGEWSKRKGKGLFPALDTLLEKRAKLKVELNYAQKMIKREKTADRLEGWEHQAVELRLAIDDLEKRIRSEFPEYNAFIEPRVLDLNGLGEKLKISNSILVEYYLAGDTIFIFSHDGDALSVHAVGGASELEKYGDQILNNFKLSSVKEKNNFIQAAQRLYNALIKPVGLSSKKRLVIVPDGWLNHIPFDVFLTEKNNGKNIREWPFLLRENPVSYVWSAVMWNGFEEKENNIENALGAAPIFAGSTDFLRYSEEELAFLKELDSGILLKEKATIKAFSEHAPKYDVLHLSTHASSSGSLGHGPEIKFADGSMLLSDLQVLQLKAKMAVLSACETHLGEERRGEGVMSLSRGFACSGVQSVLATLWSVNERSTANIIGGFYDEILRGKNKDIALQKAKLNYLKTCQDTKVAPYYWAGFTLMGDTVPLKINAKNWLFSLSLIIVLLSFLIYFFKKIISHHYLFSLPAINF